MEESLITLAARATVMLLLVVDPIGVAPIFAALTQSLNAPERAAILRRAVMIAVTVALFFLLAGSFVLARLGVSVDAFAISGGILLFAAAMPMLFGGRGALQAPEKSEGGAPDASDIAVFPLAIPLLSGPGTITTIILLSHQPSAGLAQLMVLVAVIAAVFLLSWFVLSFGERLIAQLGKGKIHIITRVLGIVLAALAVQYVLNGVRGFYHSLAPS